MKMVRYMSSEEGIPWFFLGFLVILVILGLSICWVYPEYNHAIHDEHVIKIGVIEKRDIGGVKYLKLVSSHCKNGEMVYDFDNLDEVYDAVEVNKSYDATIMYPTLRITKIDGKDVDHQ